MHFKKIIIFILFFSVISSFFSSCTKKKKSYSDVFIYFYNASDFIEKSYYDKALVELDKAMRIRQKFAPGYYFQGTCFQLKKEFNKALIKYEKAIKLYPNYWIVYMNLAKLHFSQGRFYAAIRNYNQAIDILKSKRGGDSIVEGFKYSYKKFIDKEYTTLFAISYNLAKLFAFKRELEDAAKWNKQAKKSAKKYESLKLKATLQEAIILMLQGKILDALPVIKTAKEKMGTQEAEDYYNIVKELYSKNIDASALFEYYSAEVYREVGDISSAMSYYERAASVSPNFCTAIVKLGNLQLIDKKFFVAKENFRKCIDSSSTRVSARVGLADTYSEKFEFSTASRHIKRAISFREQGSSQKAELEKILSDLKSKDAIIAKFKEYRQAMFAKDFERAYRTQAVMVKKTVQERKFVENVSEEYKDLKIESIEPRNIIILDNMHAVIFCDYVYFRLKENKIIRGKRKYLFIKEADWNLVYPEDEAGMKAYINGHRGLRDRYELYK